MLDIGERHKPFSEHIQHTWVASTLQNFVCLKAATFSHSNLGTLSSGLDSMPTDLAIGTMRPLIIILSTALVIAL